MLYEFLCFGIILQAILDSISDVTGGCSDGSQLRLPTQCIYYDIAISRLIFQLVVKFSKEILPPNLLQSELLLCLKVATGHVLDLKHELGPK